MYYGPLACCFEIHYCCFDNAYSKSHKIDRVHPSTAALDCFCPKVEKRSVLLGERLIMQAVAFAKLS